MDQSEKRRILITGANGGMGRICAEFAAEQGYSLVLVDLAHTDLDGLAGFFADKGISASVHALDITDPTAVADLINAIEAEGGIDAVVHTVGVSPNMTDWQRIIEIDLLASAKFIAAIRPVLKPAGAAVCFSSSSAYMCPPIESLDRFISDPMQDDFLSSLQSLPQNPLTNTGLAYAWSKLALQKFVVSQALVWGAEGKRLVSLSPGVIDTAMGRLEYENTENIAAMKSQIALGELGKPEHIADAALFLVSEKAAYITGCDILVDGGFVAGFLQQSR